MILGGIITGMRTVITKQGKNAGSKMGILRIEDLQGQIEAIVFPDQLSSSQGRPGAGQHHLPEGQGGPEARGAEFAGV